MCECEVEVTSRREMLQVVAAALMTLLPITAEASPETPQQDAGRNSTDTSPSTPQPLTREQRDRLTPNAMLLLAKQGNERFQTGKAKPRNLVVKQKIAAGGQYPAAVILSCIDSRAPVEMILDLTIGDVFSSRVAGNVASTDILGSMEFACKVSGAKVVLVMGHTSCGAVKGAIDGVQLGNLTQLLDKIKPAVAATDYSGNRTSKNAAFVDAVARQNVVLTIDYIRANSPTLAAMEKEGAIKIAGGDVHYRNGAGKFLLNLASQIGRIKTTKIACW